MTWSRTKPQSDVHGWAHRIARREWAARHHPEDPCVRCGQPLGPMSGHLHLDHHDTDKTRYLGFSHAACNLGVAGQLGRRRQRQPHLGSSALDW